MEQQLYETLQAVKAADVVTKTQTKESCHARIIEGLRYLNYYSDKGCIIKLGYAEPLINEVCNALSGDGYGLSYSVHTHYEDGETTYVFRISRPRGVHNTNARLYPFYMTQEEVKEQINGARAKKQKAEVEELEVKLKLARGDPRFIRTQTRELIDTALDPLTQRERCTAKGWPVKWPYDKHYLMFDFEATLYCEEKSVNGYLFTCKLEPHGKDGEDPTKLFITVRKEEDSDDEE